MFFGRGGFPFGDFGKYKVKKTFLNTFLPSLANLACQASSPICFRLNLGNLASNGGKKHLNLTNKHGYRDL